MVPGGILLFGCMAGFGMTAVLDFLLDRRLWPTRLGGAYLRALGVRALLQGGRP